MRQPFFGETHVHTKLSLDASTQGTRLSPDDAYAFARGETIGIQPYDEEGNATRSLTIDAPLDFVMVSDHAEFFGTLAICSDPEREEYDDPECQLLRDDPEVAFFALNVHLGFPESIAAYPELCGDAGALCIEAGADVWAGVQQSAEAAYDRSASCEFTTFIGYEWTGSPGTKNLHRNVMFANAVVPEVAVNYFDQPYVEGLWRELRSLCSDADDGCDVLTIAHNSNLSIGSYFQDQMGDGNPFDEGYVAARNAMEPLFELYQHKGDSECLPGTAIADELCGFEKVPFNNLADAALDGFSPPVPMCGARSGYRSLGRRLVDLDPAERVVRRAALALGLPALLRAVLGPLLALLLTLFTGLNLLLEEVLVFFRLDRAPLRVD